ncbi:MAG: YoaK family protein [Verrucomicrobia bacterium]|nr:YoaK family protein [Verrucomicrobiota bacterium]
MNGPKPDAAPGFRAPREAFLLAGVGGSIDAVGILTLGGLFVAHMSGNSASFGAAFGQGDWAKGLPHLLAIPVFVLGLFLGYLWILSSRTYRRCAVLLAVEAFLLAVFFVLVRTGIGLPAAIPALLAMGLQNATLRELGFSSFPTTYVTGVLDMLGKSAARAVLEGGGPALSDARRAGAVWLSYATGAILGSAGLAWLGVGIVFVPVVILGALATRFARTGSQLGEHPAAR